MSFEAKIAEFERIVKKFKHLELGKLYAIIDRIEGKTPPPKTKTYFQRYGQWIQILENKGILLPSNYAQVWEIKSEKGVHDLNQLA